MKILFNSGQATAPRARFREGTTSPAIRKRVGALVDVNAYDATIPVARGDDTGGRLRTATRIDAPSRSGTLAPVPAFRPATMKPARLRRLMNLWPPFLFAGIRVLDISADWRRARVALRRRWYNRNYVGTHFGGSLFAMTDPFWMILTMQRLGRDYIVWDKAGEIEFVAPGREDVYAEFEVDEAMLEEIRAATANGKKYLRWCETPVVTASGEVVARVRKQLYVREKPRRADDPQRPVS